MSPSTSRAYTGANACTLALLAPATKTPKMANGPTFAKRSKESLLSTAIVGADCLVNSTGISASENIIDAKLNNSN